MIFSLEQTLGTLPVASRASVPKKMFVRARCVRNYEFSRSDPRFFRVIRTIREKNDGAFPIDQPTLARRTKFLYSAVPQFFRSPFSDHFFPFHDDFAGRQGRNRRPGKSISLIA
jgi:hypothetical protein